jgi:hypothetical protein
MLAPHPFERRRADLLRALWGAAAWALKLAREASFDPEALRFVTVADLIERIYSAGSQRRSSGHPDDWIDRRISR